MNNLLQDLSTLSTIEYKNLEKLMRKAAYCVCEAVEEDVIEEKDISAIDFGLGVLYIKHVAGEEFKYRFIPSKVLQKALVKTVENKANVMEDSLNKALAKRFTDIKKDLI